MFGICGDAFGRLAEPIEATRTSSKIRGDDGMSLGDGMVGRFLFLFLGGNDQRGEGEEVLSVIVPRSFK